MGPAHSGAADNEVVDRYAKSATTGEDPVEDIPDGHASETSRSHMTRVATRLDLERRQSRSRLMSGPSDDTAPPPGRGFRQTQLRNVRKTLAVRYCQLLSGHAAIGTNLLRFGMTDTSK